MKTHLFLGVNALRFHGRAARRLAALAMLLVAAATGCSRPRVAVPAPVEQALLTDDWAQIDGSLANVDERTPDPVLRLVKGHACLALNANNQALGLFLSVRRDADLDRCRAWATGFAKEHPSSAAAHYFRGDLSSRRGERDAAVQSLSKALALSPNHLLARHARAVVYATQGNYQAASDDFRAARADSPKLAELHVSYATYLVQKRADAHKALEEYEEALKISPDYVLALNGRGAMLVLLQRPPEAEAALTKAKQLSVGSLAEMAGVADLNLGALTGKTNKAPEQNLAAVAGWKPGTTIDYNVHKSIDVNINKHWESPFKKDWLNPGGISSREIAAGVDRGDWNVFMSYGLLYKVQAGV